MGPVILVVCQSDLPQVVHTARPRRGVPHLLDGRQKQTHQDRNDRDRYEFFDQRQARPL